MSIAEKGTLAPTLIPDANQTLLEAERLHALGRTANTIAHDIDVALAPITLYAEALLEHEPLSDRARHYLVSIRRAVSDVTQNVARLRELERPSELPRETPHVQRHVLCGAKPARVAHR